MKNLSINVEGMMCSGCENRVQNSLSTISGIKSVKANHLTGIVDVTFSDEVNENIIYERIEALGFKIIK